MANNDTSIQVAIQANIKDLQKKLTRAEGRLKQFDKVSGQATKQTAKFGKTVSTNAVPAMTSFSQVIQDAPYGIRGVANNITQLTAQFGYLQKSTGSAKGALKSMLGALTGPAGILLAVSVVTSLLVSYGDTLFKTKSKTEELKSAQDELNESLQKYKEGLTGVAKASLDGSQNAAKEIVNLRLLVAQANNATLSTEKRTEAIDELRKKYPSYLKGITDEKVLADGLSGVYDKLSTSILKKAKAQAAASIITENYKKELILQAQLDEQIEKTSEKRISLAEEEAKKTVELVNLSTKAFSKKDIAAAKVNDSLKEETELQEEIVKLQKDSLKLAEQIKDLGGVLPISAETGEVVSFIKNVRDAVDGFAKDIKPIAAKAGGDLQDAFIKNLEPIGVKTNTLMANLGEMIVSEIDRFNNAANELIQTSISKTFSGIGEAIGEALSTGKNAFQAIGNAILAGLGNFLSEMGGMLIKYGTLAVLKGKLDIAILTGGPAAIAAGAAAIAVGVALKAAGAALGKAANGGGGGGGDSRLSTDFSQSSQGASSFGGSSVSGGGFRGGNVVFEIAGTKLVGVLSNTLNKNKALGGNNTLALT